MNTVLTQNRLSGLACGRCRIKYTPWDLLTTIPVINFVTEISCTRPGTNIVPESSCTMPEANTVCQGYQQVFLVIVCRQDNSLKGATTASFHNLSNSLITNHHSTLYHLTNGRRMIMMRHFSLRLGLNENCAILEFNAA